MWESFFGIRSQPVKNVIEAKSIKRFARAIGDDSPIYLDEEYAKTSPHGQIIAPPTFPRTLDYGQIEGVEFPKEGMLHGEQTFHYKRPLYAGDEIYCCYELYSFDRKQGKKGALGILKVKQYGCKDQKLEEQIFTSIRTLIFTEKVLKEVEANEKPST
ncbi:MaoC family dehydratase N-terminal domain-containing protein [Salinibacillus xinjiangensis]|uniref:MaoC family dehydratase n=1 Tax=Salinibacillus xinjiangensis TaxID=1229268 RepID=A0A6G1X1U9_9BACI|nr:MaoC family dehydratase N-terminal domain-containing protein [Salinibacillus xinjiangensis]MRG84914.1 MaoC family dehydratase [Salinibacillus xinjiangensis]